MGADKIACSPKKMCFFVSTYLTIVQLVYKELSRLKPKAQDNWLAIEDEVKKWLSNKGNTDRKIRDYRAMI